MAITLYDATVGHFIRQLHSVDHLLSMAAKFCEENNQDVQRIVDAQIRFDMLPFRYQVEASIGHSVGALEGVKGGEFLPPKGTRDADHPALRAQVATALAKLKDWRPEDVEALAKKDVVFNLGPERVLPFVGEDFLMSFSVPNFFFHVTTAYDIMRGIGVPLGKKDFLGRIKLKQ
jgi:uncharacterized protein